MQYGFKPKQTTARVLRARVSSSNTFKLYDPNMNHSRQRQHGTAAQRLKPVFK